MIYYQDIDLLESYKKSTFFRAYIRKKQDEDGFYWNLSVSVDDPKDVHIHLLYNICNADTYEELMINLPPFIGTSKKEAGLKIERKLRRSYEGYNRARRQVLELQENREK